VPVEMPAPPFMAVDQISDELRVIVLAGKIAPPYPPFDGAPVKRRDHTIR